MNRRESFKTLLIGTVAGATISSSACKSNSAKEEDEVSVGLYGRQPHEIERDQKLNEEQFLNVHELETIAVLCDIILPASATAGSAGEAGVPAFIEFISKDLPEHQVPLRGGLMWLDIESNKRFNKEFKTCDDSEQLAIVDDIAFPDPDGDKPEMGPGIRFFTRMRNLTLTGYYTSQMGIADLGYVGNRPNVWDGVPEEVLQKHGMSYEPDWLAKCIDQETRNTKAEWDENGNLIT